MDTAAASFHPDAITEDSANVYWTTQEGEVFSRPKEGGPATQLTSSRWLGFPRGIWVDGANVYFIGVDGTTNTGGLLSVPLAGGDATPIADVTNVGVDATGIYWAEPDPAPSQPYNMQIRHRDTDGVVSTLAHDVLSPNGQLVLDETYVYWADLREVQRAPKTEET